MPEILGILKRKQRLSQILLPASSVLLPFFLGILIESQAHNTGSAEATADLLSQARTSYESINYKKAIKELHLFLEKHPQDKEAMRLRGKSYLAESDFAKAIEDFEAAGTSPGPLEEAMANQDRVDQNDTENLDYPDWLEALVLLYTARLQAEHGETDNALRLCQKALARKPVFPECLSLKADILMKENRLYEAEELYRQAVSLRPADWHFWYGFAGILEKQQKLSAALLSLDRALSCISSPPYPEPNLEERSRTMKQKRDKLARRIRK